MRGIFTPPPLAPKVSEALWERDGMRRSSSFTFASVFDFTVTDGVCIAMQLFAGFPVQEDMKFLRIRRMAKKELLG